MSGTETSRGHARTSPTGTLAIVFGLVIVALGGWALWSADPAIDRSVIGTAGLPVAVEGVEMVTQPVRVSQNRPEPALRILPLYDNDLLKGESEFSQSRDLRQELRQTNAVTLRSKMRRAPTLIVLPKWRLGALAQAVFHPTYLADPETLRAPNLNRRLGVDQAEPVFETFTPAGRFALPVTLYAAQTMRLSPNGSCTPVVWRGGRRYAEVLLARCRSGRVRFHVLSDPDLISNHGLGLGENVAFARAMIASLASGGQTYLDLHDGTTFPRATRSDDRGRSFADLARFFSGPFAPVWMALALLCALALWRGAVRFGRVEEGGDDFLDASRDAMIAADARILRASGATAPLLQRHVEDRLSAAARSVFGRRATIDTFVTALTRRAPDRARTLRDAIEAPTPDRSAAPAWLARFDAALASAQQEFRT